MVIGVRKFICIYFLHESNNCEKCQLYIKTVLSRANNMRWTLPINYNIAHAEYLEAIAGLDLSDRPSNPEQKTISKRTETILSFTFTCHGTCGETFSGPNAYQAAEFLHQNQCNNPAHPGFKYYRCPPNEADGCTKSNEHGSLCGGCGRIITANNLREHAQVPCLKYGSGHETNGHSYHACQVHKHIAIRGDCGDSYKICTPDAHRLIPANSWSCHCATHAFYACQASDHISVTGDCEHTFYECQRDSGEHVKARCPKRARRVRCRYEWWQCQYPNAPSYGPSHNHRYGIY